MDRKVSKDGRMKETSSRLVSAEQKTTLEMSLIWPEGLVKVSKLTYGWLINFNRMEEAAPRLVSAEQKTQLEMSLIWPEGVVKVSKLTNGWVINFNRMEEAGLCLQSRRHSWKCL